MNLEMKTEFFDSIADKWDQWEDLSKLEARLANGLEEFGVGDGERILDVGCGTGNLTRALLKRLSHRGSVIAVDVSSRMIDVAQGKVDDPRVSWMTSDVRQLPLSDAECDRVFCFSVWPHFDDKQAVAEELARVLKQGGMLLVWHLVSRARVNEIHAGAGEAVRGDVLPSAQETASLLRETGFEVVTATESEQHYLVTAVKPKR